VNSTDVVGDGPGQPAYDILAIERTFLRINVSIFYIQGIFHTAALNLSTLSIRINILLLHTDCRGGRTAAIARHVSIAQITCRAKLVNILAKIAHFKRVQTFNVFVRSIS